METGIRNPPTTCWQIDTLCRFQSIDKKIADRK
jgi:hypothetical protein